MALDRETAIRLAQSAEASDRRLAAKEAALPYEYLSQLAHDDITDVQKATVQQIARMSIDDIKDLASSEDAKIRSDVAFYLGNNSRGQKADISDNLRAEYENILSELSEDINSSVRLRVADNRNTPIDVLKNLSMHDKSELIREKADSSLKLAEQETKTRPRRTRDYGFDKNVVAKDGRARDYFKALAPEVKDVVKGSFKRHINDVKDFIGLEKKYEAVCNEINKIKDSIGQGIENCIDELDGLTKEQLQAEKEFKENLSNIRKDLVSNCHNAVSEFKIYQEEKWNDLKKKIRDNLDNAEDMIKSTKDSVISKAEETKNKIAGYFAKAKEKCKELSESLADTFENAKNRTIIRFEKIKSSIQDFDINQALDNLADTVSNKAHQFNIDKAIKSLDKCQMRMENIQNHINKVDYNSRRGGIKGIINNISKNNPHSIYNMQKKTLASLESKRAFYQKASEGHTAYDEFKEAAEINNSTLSFHITDVNPQTGINRGQYDKNIDALEYFTPKLESLNEKGNINTIHSRTMPKNDTHRLETAYFYSMVQKDFEYKQSICKALDAGMTVNEIDQLIDQATEQHMMGVGRPTLNSDTLDNLINEKIADLNINSYTEKQQTEAKDVMVDFNSQEFDDIGNALADFEAELPDDIQSADEMSAGEFGAMIAGGQDVSGLMQDDIDTTDTPVSVIGDDEPSFDD